MFTRIGRERGWPPTTRAQFEANISPGGALFVGSPQVVTDKLRRTSQALGGIDRFTVQIDVGGRPHEQTIKAIELLATEVAPAMKEKAEAATH